MQSDIVIFDGHNTFIRNYCVNPTSDSNGIAIGGIVGTLKSIRFMIEELHPKRVFFVWDAEGGSNKRRGVLAEYKAGRKPRLNRDIGEDETAKQSEDNMGWQMDKLRPILDLLGVIQIAVPDIEADDAIAYLIGCLDDRTKCIVSTDRDMWQLVSPSTTVYWPTKKTFITEENFGEHSNVSINNFTLVRAMSGRGDVSDNIHGIKGLGEKTILKLFPDFSLLREIDPPTFFKKLEDDIKLNQEGNLKLSASEKRWREEILANKELVRQNVELMQLRSPFMSAQSANIVRQAIERKPEFKPTMLKILIMNTGMQLTDVDPGVFKEYQVRSTSF